MTDATTTIGVGIEPLDTLFFRDGRPFDAASRPSSGLPVPQTLAGALRTWFMGETGCDFRALGQAMGGGATFAEALGEQGPELAAIAELSFRGPWFTLDDEPVVPVPACLRRVEGNHRLVRQSPMKVGLPGWRPPEAGMLPLWVRVPDRLARVDGYITLGGLGRFVAGDVPEPGDVVAGDKLFGLDRRTRIAVDPVSLSAAEGMIYAVGLLVTRPEVGFYAEITGPDGVLGRLGEATEVMAFGGEGRRVTVRRREPVSWPAPPHRNGRGGTTILLTAPAPLDGGWKPGSLSPVSAAVPGHVAVSGWDMARAGPKPNRFAAAAGSVYFLERPLDPPPGHRSLCGDEDGRLGWGSYVEGVWDHA